MILVVCEGCHKPTSPGPRCEACNVARLRGNDNGWRRQRRTRAFLAANPVCAGVVDGRPCGRPSTELDHVIPLEAGGPDEPDNWQPMCSDCHHDKTYPVTNPRRPRRRAGRTTH